MQVDGYKGYARVFALKKAIEVGCFMHMRRYFVRALDSKDVRAVIPVEKIRAIYRVERAAKDMGDTPDERLQRRERDSLPILLSLRNWLDEQIGRHPPKSLLGRAVTYADNHWEAMCRPWEDGRLEIDNGDVERALRGNAVGRKNWLFAGSDEGAERAAIIHTVVESAARHGLEVEAYLRDVLMKIASGWSNKRLGELLPHCWQEPGTDGTDDTDDTDGKPESNASPEDLSAIRAPDDSS
jgi:transposase